MQMTRRIRWTLAIGAVLSGALMTATGITGQGDATTPAGTVAAYHEALATADTTAALALLADDVMVLEGGHLENLEEYRSHHLPADMEFSAGVQSERTVVQTVIEGDVAWVVSKSLSKGKFRDHDIDSSGAELIVLTRDGESWKIRAIHWSSYRNKK